MEIDINWLAVVAAAITSMVIPMAWYSDKSVFGKAWEGQTHITTENLKKARGKMPFYTLFIMNVTTALVLTVAITIVSAYLKDTSVLLALVTGFVLWLGFSSTTLIQHNMFELKSNKLTFINNSYQLVLFLAIAFVVGLFL